MNIILLLIPLSIVLLVLGTWAFFWAVNHSQFDDLDTPALSPLADDEFVQAQVDRVSTPDDFDAPALIASAEVHAMLSHDLSDEKNP